MYDGHANVFEEGGKNERACSPRLKMDSIMRSLCIWIVSLQAWGY